MSLKARNSTILRCTRNDVSLPVRILVTTRLGLVSGSSHAEKLMHMVDNVTQDVWGRESDEQQEDWRSNKSDWMRPSTGYCWLLRNHCYPGLDLSSPKERIPILWYWWERRQLYTVSAPPDFRAGSLTQHRAGVPLAEQEPVLVLIVLTVKLQKMKKPLTAEKHRWLQHSPSQEILLGSILKGQLLRRYHEILRNF